MNTELLPLPKVQAKPYVQKHLLKEQKRQVEKPKPRLVHTDWQLREYENIL